VIYSTAFDTEEEAEGFIEKVLGAISETGKADGALKLGTHAHPRYVERNLARPAVETLYWGTFGFLVIEQKEYKAHDLGYYHVRIES